MEANEIHTGSADFGRTPARRPKNQILAALPSQDRARLEPHLVRVRLEIRDLLIDVHQPIEHVYFPEGCMVSLVGVMADGSAVETATIGDEGMVGMPLFHRTDRVAAQAFCQVPGPALRLSADVFLEELDRSPALVDVLHRYALALFVLVGQSSACNRLHTMAQRCARWLLHTHDRVGARLGVDEFSLTQQFLSQMLGVRRATVSETMSKLQESGSVAYERGLIRIRERARLESTVCECYRVVKSEFDRLLGVAPGDEARTLSPLDRARTSDGEKSTTGDAVPEEGA